MQNLTCWLEAAHLSALKPHCVDNHMVDLKLGWPLKTQNREKEWNGKQSLW